MPHFQSQNSSFEMTPNPNNLMGYGSGTIPYTEENKVSGEIPFNTRVFEIDDYSLQENDQLFNEEIIPIDILDGDFDTNDLMLNFKENENGKKQSGKRKVSELQLTERWSDEKTDKLLSYLEDNYEKLQQEKKAAVYNSISIEVIKTKTSASIKRWVQRLLVKYENVKKQNNQTGSERVDWKCDKEEKEVKNTKRKKNSVESLLQSERLEVEKQKWEYEREQAHMRHELLMKQIELQIAQTQNKQ
ncbi:hypothetical protein RhiirA4_489117 [Rhizophagus irregularis]|uniref:Uncharacterized protein n=1 Tax=Rhizophagus irregularis TaxID=588596 RepID=A0A2I1HUG7_9GLOM|nr:hypothetical protein RhiirA4_489117 [Rhizophagus irregularis]